MGFFKEMKEAFLQGREEAKQELQQEQEQLEQQREKAREAIAQIPPRKHLVAAAAAPFRVTVFQDWFSVFKDDGGIDNHLPLHLHTFGEPDLLSDEQLKDLAEVLERDMEITDRDTVMIAAAFFAAPFWDYLTEYEDQKARDYKEEVALWGGLDKTERIALTIAIMGHLLTGAADLGYITADQAVELMAEPLAALEERFTNWVQYGEAVIAGEELTGLNNSLGKKLLSKYVGYLETKQGSPWKYVSIK